MVKAILSIAIVCAVALAGFFFGSIYTSIMSSLCYAGVIDSITKEAKTAITTGPTALSGFQGLIDSLPLQGYETSCEEVESALQKIRGVPSAVSHDPVDDADDGD